MSIMLTLHVLAVNFSLLDTTAKIKNMHSILHVGAYEVVLSFVCRLMKG